jgi:hypothetical protein
MMQCRANLEWENSLLNSHIRFPVLSADKASKKVINIKITDENCWMSLKTFFMFSRQKWKKVEKISAVNF